MDSKAKAYEAPKVTIVSLGSHECLLVTSNEGLWYEDLFSPAANAFPPNEDPFAFIP